jgi:hypothetical protein
MPSAIGFMAAKIDDGREVPRLSPRCPGNQKLGRYPPASNKPGLFKEAVEPTGWLTGLIPERSRSGRRVLSSASPESIGTEPPTCKTLRVPDRSTSDSYNLILL